MYMVRFIRQDGQPNEEYFYNNQLDAEHHLNLFRNDDSNLYDRIELLRIENVRETMIEAIQF